MHDTGRRVLDVRKVLREFLGGDYPAIRQLTEQIPAVVARDCDPSTAEDLARRLRDLGAHVEVVT